MFEGGFRRFFTAINAVQHRIIFSHVIDRPSKNHRSWIHDRSALNGESSGRDVPGLGRHCTGRWRGGASDGVWCFCSRHRAACAILLGTVTVDVFVITTAVVVIITGKLTRHNSTLVHPDYLHTGARATDTHIRAEGRVEAMPTSYGGPRYFENGDTAKACAVYYYLLVVETIIYQAWRLLFVKRIRGKPLMRKKKTSFGRVPSAFSGTDRIFSGTLATNWVLELWAVSILREGDREIFC